ncbi:MAG: RNA 2',3'-cyclic phosphodiesterase [Deltaproteobacteria bacterium]|nr:RNA 2',3'-cyclic phosphodiesterase [Deltaproteobacteria bacterium]
MPRLFVAVNMSAEVNAKLASILRSQDFAGQVNWVRPENLHLTVKFLGAVAAEKLPRVTQLVREAAKFLPLRVSAQGAGAFPDVQTGKVLWIGIHEHSGKLSALAAYLDEKFAVLGIARETREYSPHLTLGHAQAGQPAARYVAAYSKSSFGISLVSELVLYESETLPAGPRYTPLFVQKVP